jgi:hypothetical protein
MKRDSRQVRSDSAIKAAKSKRARARRLERKYGLTEHQYNLMEALYGGRCWVCNRKPKRLRLAVEHDHKTGRVRGLACWHCNKYVIGRNTVDTARFLVEYLSSDFDGRTLP